jgi:hypothetical protein
VLGEFIGSSGQPFGEGVVFTSVRHVVRLRCHTYADNGTKVITVVTCGRRMPLSTLST